MFVQWQAYPSILSVLQPWVILGFLNHPSEADCWVSEQIVFTVWG
jgi:hypothetical protein